MVFSVNISKERVKKSKDSYCAFLVHTLESSKQKPREAILGKALTGCVALI